MKIKKALFFDALFLHKTGPGCSAAGTEMMRRDSFQLITVQNIKSYGCVKEVEE